MIFLQKYFKIYNTPPPPRLNFSFSLVIYLLKKLGDLSDKMSHILDWVIVFFYPKYLYELGVLSGGLISVRLSLWQRHIMDGAIS